MLPHSALGARLHSVRSEPTAPERVQAAQHGDVHRAFSARAHRALPFRSYSWRWYVSFFESLKHSFI